MLTLKHFTFLSALLLLAGKSYATCERNKHTIFEADDPIIVTAISLPSDLVVESRDYSAGEVIYSSGYDIGTPGSTEIVKCGNNYVVGWFYLHEPQLSMGSGGTIAATNLPGLGVRVTTTNQAGPYDSPMVVDNSWHNGDGGANHTLNSSAYRVELVALGGPIASGELVFSSPFAQVEFKDSPSSSSIAVASQLNLSNAVVLIKAMGCTADISMIRFPFGTINLNQFSGVTTVSGAPDQTVTLSCEPGSAVALSVTAEAAAGDNAGGTVIALTGSGTEGVASGVGVQLGLKTSGYDSEDNGVPLNQNIELITSQRFAIDPVGSHYVRGGAAATETLIFSAKYYKTAATVTAGTANATATLNLTYN